MDLLFPLLWNRRPSVEPRLTLFLSSLWLYWTLFLLSWWISPINPQNKSFVLALPSYFTEMNHFSLKLIEFETFIWGLSLAFPSILPMCRPTAGQVVPPPKYTPQVFTSAQPSFRSKSPLFTWIIVVSSPPVLPLNWLMHSLHRSQNTSLFYFLLELFLFVVVGFSRAQYGMLEAKRKPMDLSVAFFLRPWDS